ncbi:hypothetical protein AZE42_04413 [Rhizopogon vesiculosus]|uniref:Uncharacterized protein n=1 Tax=Rhizopogon vesiculosus TaxID=180088 RepID=A0A1J8PYF5_9AGAM|nr:hypothetical protein AZE42_04413 [Rhizopogon vesiculosus]
MSVSLKQTLSRVSDGNEIIATDFSTTVLINHVDETLITAECEVQHTSSAIPLRYLLAGYIEQPLPYHYLELDKDGSVTRMHGAPNDPRFPLPADKGDFATRRAHFDFDRYPLTTGLHSISFSGGRLTCKQHSNSFL